MTENTSSQNAPVINNLPASVYGKLSVAGYDIHERDQLKIAFVGQSTFFEVCSIEPVIDWADVSFFDHRAGADCSALKDNLEACNPNIIIVFRPELIPKDLFTNFRAITLGYLTEPLPRSPKNKHKDLKRRLSYLEPLDPNNFDRIVSFDPLIADTASEMTPVWRSLPLPVSDRVYREPQIQYNPQPIFVGRSTKHREKFLGSIKHKYDILHIAHGLGMDALLELFDRSSVAINVHNNKYPSFENRIALHLAAGHLLISEPLSPSHGLEAGIDYLEIKDPDELFRAITVAINKPSAFMKMRLRGRQKAELFRASNVYPRLIFDLLYDVSVFGSERTLDA